MRKLGCPDRTPAWKSGKYEELCLHAHESVRAAQASICRYLVLYNAADPARP